MSLNKTINIITLGCSKNLVDSEKLMRQVEAGGYSVVHNSENEKAHTVIINTCGFINDAREESIDTILRFVRARERGKINNLFVMGCLSERYRDELQKEIPEVDMYFGVHDMTDIVTRLGIGLRYDLLTDRSITGPGHYAYLKVSEGCDRSCSFCAIPAIRGKCVSRSIGDIIEEARNLADKGVKELILIAQDLSYYGLDLYRKQMLPELLEELVGLNEFEWIRLHYLYPANFPYRVIDIMKENPVICRYIDIPIQHISNRILSSMRRSHNRQETENVLNYIRKELPDAVIRTTLIAGYPGETDDEYRELRDYVKEFRFDRLGVFAYSHEEGTQAYLNYEDDIPEELKEKRVSELMEIQQAISEEKNMKLIGKTCRVIIDRREGNYFTGRTEYDSPEVDQEVLVPAEYDIVPGGFYDIIITSASDFDLFGVPQKK